LSEINRVLPFMLIILLFVAGLILTAAAAHQARDRLSAAPD
jgi:hypothetical protein